MKKPWNGYPAGKTTDPPKRKKGPWESIVILAGEGYQPFLKKARQIILACALENPRTKWNLSAFDGQRIEPLGSARGFCYPCPDLAIFPRRNDGQ